MKRKVVIAIMLLLSLALSACVGGAGEGSEAVSETVSEEESKAPEYGEFKTAFRFLVTSDNHVSAATDASAQRLAQLFKSAYAYAEKQDYKKVDAFVAAGDITNYGYEYEYKAWKSVVDANIKEETTVITVMGNHEFYGGISSGNYEQYEEYYKNNIDENLNKHVVVGGYHFIGLGNYPENGQEGNCTKYLDWLEAELDAAATADPDKPIITFQHHHIKDTVYVSEEWYSPDSTALNALYSKYSQVLNFSGHSHGPINHLGSVYQKDYTLFGTGTLSYFELTTGMTYGTVPPNASNAAQFYIVEISEDNRVRVMPYNLLTDDFFKTSDGKEQLVYSIDNLKDKSTWLYTDSRKTETQPPVFADGTSVTVGKVTASTAEITFPQATDDHQVYSYNIVAQAEGDKQEYNYFSEFYFEPMPETLTFVLAKLKAGTEYTVTVNAVDVFGKKSGSGITGTFTTAGSSTGEYTSQNPVTYMGTFTDFNSIKTLTFSNGLAGDGDVLAADWYDATNTSTSNVELTQNGYNGSNALAVWATKQQNQSLYVFATDENGNTAAFPSTKYLRVWVDFTGVDFRKANFGLVAPSGDLYTTDEKDGVSGLEFYYLAEGATEWKTYTHGTDGCFGQAEGASVKDFKGWMAFPTADFNYRSGTGTGTGSGSFSESDIAGVYMYWDYINSSLENKKFVIDELHLVEDYKSFDEYKK